MIEKVGQGWEGEVYRLQEKRTGIELAAKLFFPQRDPKDKAVLSYARKMYRLRHCSIATQYHTEEFIQHRGCRITVLISEFVDGVPLEQFVRNRPGKRLDPFTALHLLYALARGMEDIHAAGEYHGDLHTENIIVVKHGLEFGLKLLDMYNWGRAKPANFRDDLIEMIRVFYDVLGGQERYAQQPATVKQICCGMKYSLIQKKFKSVSALRQHLETLEWRY